MLAIRRDRQAGRSPIASMPATVIAERADWSGSMSWFRMKVVVLLRPEYEPKDPPDRLAFAAVDRACCPGSSERFRAV